MSARKPNLKKLQTHMLGGCGYAGDKVVLEAYVESLTHTSWDGTPYTNYNAVPRTVENLREVTCGYCKTKLTNELWFKDWSTLTDRELDFVEYLRHTRNIRKGRTP